MMMFLSEVLQLEKVQTSIKKIDLFLADCIKFSVDYAHAYSYRAIILHTLGKTNDALKALYGLVGEFKNMEEASIIAICDAIIYITLDVNRLDQAKKYIEVKKNYLKVSHYTLYIKDMINYYLASKQVVEAINGLQKYLADDITQEEETWALDALTEVYYKEHQYENYLECAEKLEKTYQDNINMSALHKIALKKLTIYFESGNYVRVICDANQFLNEHDADDTTQLQVATLLIKSYLKSKDYRRAAILESNYEEKMSLVDTAVALPFAKAALELYTQTNSLVSINHYQNLIQTLSTTKKQEKSSKKRTKNLVVIPQVENESVEEDIYPILERQVIATTLSPITSTVKNVKTVCISQTYDHLAKLFHTLNTLDKTVKFREVFRNACIELTSFLPLEEAYVLYYHNQYVGLHYKKERAYDKKLNFDDIEDTLNFLSINLEQEVFLDKDAKNGLKDIVTSKYYEEIPYAVCFPLLKEDMYFGSIAFFAREEFLQKEMCYETLKLISQMLNARLISDISYQELRQENKRMFFIYEHMSSGVKEMIDEHIHLSKQAVDILGCLEDMTTKDYEAHIISSDLAEYRKCVEEICKTLDDRKFFEYHFKRQGKWIKIKETFYPSYENGRICIYSLIEDISRYEQVHEELKKLAYTNPISKLESILKLKIDLEAELENKKLSLCILDVPQFNLYTMLYGIHFSNQLIYAIALELKRIFEEDYLVSIYHLEGHQYAILCRDQNDKRIIDAMLHKKLDLLKNNLHLLNSRLNLFFDCGIYRLAKNAPQMDAEKIISYAYEALEDANRLTEQEHHICHYDGELAKRRFNENQLITHISESIDHGKIGLAYQQVANIKQSEIFAYYAHLSLDNYDVDEQYMKQVIKSRCLEEMLDKYAISNASKEIKMLRDNVRASIYIFVEISPKTLRQNLLSFIEQQNHYFKTTKNNLVFVVEDASHPIVQELHKAGYLVSSRRVMDVYQENISYFIYDLKVNGLNLLNELSSLCQTKNIPLIVENVEKKEEITSILELPVEYVYGDYYKKKIRMKKLLDKLQN